MASAWFIERALVRTTGHQTVEDLILQELTFRQIHKHEVEGHNS